MTTEQLMDWHARRAGWELFDDGVWRRDKPGQREYEYLYNSHPFAETIDGAAAAMPPNWSWQRSAGKWWAGQIGAERWKCVQIPETSIGGEHEIHDRYLLAKLALEQEASNDGK